MLVCQEPPVAPADPQKEHWALLEARMRELTSSPAWDALLSQLDLLINEQIEDLISSPDPRRAGYIEGLRHFREYPKVLIDRYHQIRNS